MVPEDPFFRTDLRALMGGYQDSPQALFLQELFHGPMEGPGKEGKAQGTGPGTGFLIEFGPAFADDRDPVNGHGFGSPFLFKSA